MRKSSPLFLILLLMAFRSQAQVPVTRFEKTMGKETPVYTEVIDWWQKLDTYSGKVKMLTMGMTDAGYPLHLVVIANNGDHNFTNIRKNNKRVFLINNGIHPGEPDGIDATMLLAKDIVLNKIKLPDNVVLAIIPVYNIGGCLNRSPYYRVDQDGPNEFGFRGNSQNLDLNRDFIKADSKEARSFAEIFHLTQPDVFLDNHVSNGADYQHVMTLIATQHNKLGGETGTYLNKQMEPGIYASMKKKGYDLIPYVNSFGDTPEEGWPEFFEGPRYGSGYGALWSTFSFVAETHMLKPYPQRVESTLELMKSFIDFISANSEAIRMARDKDRKAVLNQVEFPLTWKLDKSRYSERLYKGFKSGYKPSEISGQNRLYYDRAKPYETTVRFYNFYEPELVVRKPKAYIIPQGWWPVIDLLKINKVQMQVLKKDTLIEVEVYHIDDYKSATRPYESHHMNTDVKTSVTKEMVKFRKGDIYIPMNQVANRFLIETLEPRAPDSYFAWNYFDGILGRKEGFSGYVFEETAAEYLKTHPELKTKLEEKRMADSNFAKNGRAQLNFVYENSVFFEPDYLRYPVYRVGN
ncbi:MAG: M14 family metallopeptidase [Chitinophagales bacterium]|nr:M14 family metallopeptidase [Chitinophagales bacterium]